MSRPAALRADSITYRRDGRTILDDITIEADHGSVTAVVGPSGSGKSTLLAILGGLELPDAGTVLNPFPREATAFILQAYGLVSLLTAAENVAVALQADPSVPRAEIQRRADEALSDVGLTPVADHLTESLSGGQQQRVAVARALVMRPRLLIADEYTAELDPRTRAVIDARIRQVARDGGTVILATHDRALASTADAVFELGESAARSGL